MSTSHPHCLAVRGPRCCLHAARQQAKHVACRPRTKSAARLPCAALAASPATALTVPAREGAPPLIKICGLTSAADAEVAAAAGADLLGMIMWQRGRRAVSPATARAIAATAHRHGVQAVGVFVDEDAEAIASACATARLDAAQLHGDGARAAFAALPTDLPVLYVLHANAAGELQTPLPDPAGQRRPEWLLVDGLQGGSGQTVDWARLAVPAAAAARGWLLAGGLAPGNVRAALALARPAGVDVASGVAGADGLRKDLALVAAFVAAVRGPAP